MTKQAPSSGSRAIQARETRKRLLAAANRVVQRDGAANLTLDTVASEAETSKGGLLHHFPTKDDLIVALLDDTLLEAGRELDERAAEAGNGPGAYACAYLDYVNQPYVAATDAASSILAAAALDDRLLLEARETFTGWQRRLVEEDGLSEDTAILARVVCDGLWLIDLFGLAPPTVEQRGAVVDIVMRRIEDEIAGLDS